jgi:hypothetical protein
MDDENRMITKIASQWKPRPRDPFHWDHPDGCFVEQIDPEQFDLYNDGCHLLSEHRSLAGAYLEHERIHPQRAATPGPRKTNERTI